MFGCAEKNMNMWDDQRKQLCQTLSPHIKHNKGFCSYAPVLVN